MSDTDPTCPPTMGTRSSSSRCLSSCREMISASQKNGKQKKDLEEPGPKHRQHSLQFHPQNLIQRIQQNFMQFPYEVNLWLENKQTVIEKMTE